MSWIARLLARIAKADATDILTQQTGDDIVNLLKELIL